MKEYEKMDFSDIVALAKAGFTAAQIAALAQQMAQPQQMGDYLSPVMEQLRALTSAVQNGNIMNSNQPAARTAEQIVAEIINPPTNGGR